MLAVENVIDRRFRNSAKRNIAIVSLGSLNPSLAKMQRQNSIVSETNRLALPVGHDRFR